MKEKKPNVSGFANQNANFSPQIFKKNDQIGINSPILNSP
jgi:hypothetical protein